MGTRLYYPVWDRLGIAAAALCAVHCLVLPLALPMLAMSGMHELADPRIEQVIVVSTLVLAAVVLWHGYRHHHGRQLPMVIAALGAVVFGIRHSFGSPNEPVLLGLGAILIISSHALNLRLHRKAGRAIPVPGGR